MWMAREGAAGSGRSWSTRPAPTLRARMRQMPPLDPSGLWEVQAKAIRNLEQSLQQDRPRALIPDDHGAGKTFTAVGFSYLLVRHGGAARIRPAARAG